MKSVFFEEKWYKKDALLFSSTNRAFKYGDGIFESLCFKEGQIRFLELHLNRLKYAADLLNMAVPRSINALELEKLLQDFSSKNNAKFGSIRIQLFRKKGDKYGPKGKSSSFVIEFNKHKSDLMGSRKKGQHALSFKKHLVQSFSSLSNIKSSNSLLYILAKDFATQNGVDDSILYNDQGFIAECSSSSIYLDMKDHLVSPPLHSGCLDGIIRKVALAQDDIPILEKDISSADLEQATAVYSSNAIEGFKWFASIDDLTFGPGRAKALNKLIQSL